MARRGDAAFGFLLEGVDDIDRAREAHRIDSAVGVAVVVVHHLQHAGAAEAPERLRPGRFAAELRLPKCTADAKAHGFRECPHILTARPDPAHRFGLRFIFGHQVTLSCHK